ncbi:hypothetical protein [Mesobacillus selenatarsenatis]|uniref:Uncharacterized protein n=1 Tax=Mesobacillus selenatarsenatis TaxID=388741 RepID=A0A846TH20_9BACI|nr:hypothetical protein [Mesobacillus selenatarsenatis]NKE04717.1 hypothetical protein [Mesobacillus selenatarsenatis]
MREFLELLKMLREKKYAVIVLILVVLTSLISFIVGLDTRVKDILIEIINIIFQYLWYVLYLAILLFTFLSLLKLFHNKAQANLQEYRGKEENYHLDALNTIKVYIKVKHHKFEVSILNTGKNMIKSLKGVFSIKENKVRIQKIPFNIQFLPPDQGERIYFEREFENLKNFDGFDIYIENIETKTLEKNNVYKEGHQLYKMHYELLNQEKLEDYTLFGLKTRYNLAWFKNDLKLMDIIKYQYQKKSFGERNPFKRSFSFVLRSLIFILIYSIIVFSILFTLFFMYKVCVMVYEILPLIYEILKITLSEKS